MGSDRIGVSTGCVITLSSGLDVSTSPSTPSSKRYFRNYERASKDQSVLTELPNNYSDDCVMVLSASIKRTFTGGLLDRRPTWSPHITLTSPRVGLLSKRNICGDWAVVSSGIFILIFVLPKPIASRWTHVGSLQNKLNQLLGISKDDLAKAITAGPAVLKRSLENQIIPSFNFFKALLHSNTKFITAFKRYPEILTIDHKAVTIPNIEIMRQHGVPESKVVFLLTNQPRLFTVKPEEFKKTVNEVKEMGFDPSKLHFVLAVHALRSMRKSTWQRKVEVYGKWGWSEEQTIQAFGKNPWCMMASEEKIMAVMDFYVNTMGWESSRIARRPKFVSLSLEKRIVPRCSVVQGLLSKGLIDKKRLRLATLLESTESSFLEKFVIRYNEQAPELLKLYQDKIGLQKS
ncbi:hypothetical protein HYC85_012928 [Camellia sinensis]|uniref:Uncharacterized protein n=1 Tax=Camellia sinensis TaxID=4442 RepID=A0A7J7HE60_CAMSI|nr:hypothetical protein HYC85_012928 [Camellia sinensis]